MKFIILVALCVSQAFGAADKDWLNPYLIKAGQSPEHSEHEVEATAAPPDLLQLAFKLKLFRLLEFLKASGLDETVLKNGGPYTIFAPTNEAFNRVLKCPWMREEIFDNNTRLAELLSYHVIAGEVFSTDLSNDMVVPTLLSLDGKSVAVRVNVYQTLFSKKVTINGKRVGYSDNKATNGVIHIVDQLLYPVPSQDMFNALNLKQFKLAESTLVAAFVAAGLDTVLNGPGPFTLFAPTNRAFEKLPAGTLDDLLKDPVKLKNLLNYHVVSGTYYTAGIKAFNGTLTTLQGGDVKVYLAPFSGKLTVNGVYVFDSDLAVTNGVVHLIDTILNPDDSPTIGAKRPMTHLQQAFGMAEDIETL